MKTRIDRNEVLRLRAEGLTQEQAAKRLGVCASTLSKWRRLNGVGWRQRCGKELARNRVNDQLRERGLTQMQVAADLGVQAPTISALAASRRVLLTDGTTFSVPAKHLADYLQLPPEWLWADLQEDFGAHPDVSSRGLLLDVQDGQEPADDMLARVEMVALLRDLVEEVCNERQRIVLAYRFGLPSADTPEPGDGESRHQIGRRLGLSRERVRQIEREAIIRLRDRLGEMLGLR